MYKPYCRHFCQWCGGPLGIYQEDLCSENCSSLYDSWCFQQDMKARKEAQDGTADDFGRQK